jgi:hypothetical protein
MPLVKLVRRAFLHANDDTAKLWCLWIGRSPYYVSFGQLSVRRCGALP